MSDLNYTTHAVLRLAQRGFRRDDAEIIFRHGTSKNDQEILMRRKDTQAWVSELRSELYTIKKPNNRSDDARISKLKRAIQNSEKLENCKIVVDGNNVITGYNITRREQRKCRIRMREAA